MAAEAAATVAAGRAAGSITSEALDSSTPVKQENPRPLLARSTHAPESRSFPGAELPYSRYTGADADLWFPWRHRLKQPEYLPPPDTTVKKNITRDEISSAFQVNVQIKMLRIKKEPHGLPRELLLP